MSKQDYKELIKNFLNTLSPESLLLEDFNEKSLQHNLGQFIKNNLGDDYIVQYERNINYFQNPVMQTIAKCNEKKTELDLAIFEKDNANNIHKNGIPLCIIEIKYLKSYDQAFNDKTATNPNLLYECLQDIMFVSFCKSNGINAYSLIVCDNECVYNKPKHEGGKKPTYTFLYKAFREGGQVLNQELINDINGQKGNYFEFKIYGNDNYSLKWNPLFGFTDEEKHSLHLKYILN